VLTLADGSIGVAFSIATTQTLSTCADAAGNTTVQVAFSVSSDGGQSWGVPTLISDRGSSSCPYDQSLEPSFAMGGGGAVFGTYVMANATMAAMFSSTGGPPVLPYTARPQDALAFVKSSDNGSSFTAPVAVVAGGNIARPALAAFGNTVYIAYENISNGTNLIPGGFHPISIQFVYSTDAGSTWKGPYTLPVEPGGTANEFNTSMSPSIAVNSQGRIAVAYADNRSCIAFCATYPAYALDVIVTSSATNGTSWGAPVRVASGVGQAETNAGSSLFQETPTTSIAFGTASRSLYVAYSGSVNLSLAGGPYASSYPFEDWSRPTLFSSSSTSDGASWTTPEMVPPPLHSADGNQNLFGEANFNPGLAVSSAGEVYLTWSYFTWENYPCGYNSFAPNALAHTSDQFVVTSTNGVDWSTPSLIASSLGSQGIDYEQYLGYSASIGFSASGAAIIAYAYPTNFFLYTGTGWFQPAILAVSTPYVGPAVNVTFVENGLTAGTAWTGMVQGVGLNTTASSFIVTGVPTGRPVEVYWPLGFIRPGAYGTYVMPVVSDGPVATFLSDSTVYFNFTEFYPVAFASDPTNIPLTYFQFTSSSPQGGFSYYVLWNPTPSGCMLPWYFPKGTVLDIGSTFGPDSFSVNGASAIGYWTGIGSGNYTGSGPYANVTVNGPINETFWFAGVGTYTEEVEASTLPTSSSFTFSLDGSTYSGQGGGSVDVPGLMSGPHTIADISATSSSSGWAYFGRADTGSPFILPEEPIVNLTFAYVDQAAPLGTVSFHAPQVPSGTPWYLTVNGTEYSSSTPWINVTTRPGSFPVLSYPVVSSDSSTVLAPVSPSSVLSVSTGDTYTVAFVSSYRFTASASLGGKVAIVGGSNTFYPVNSTIQFNATPLSGYAWGGWTGIGPGSYTGMNRSVELELVGSVQELASFYPLVADRFNLTLLQNGLPNGTLWSTFLNGVGYSSTNATLVVHNVYSYAVSGNLGRYTAVIPDAYPNGTASGVHYDPVSSTLTVDGGSSATVDFVPQYFVQIGATIGGSTSTPSQWVPSGGSVYLLEEPDPGYVFSHWQGNGTGSYTGATPSPTVFPGGAITEVAVFVPAVTPPPARYLLSIHEATPLMPGTAWSVVFNGSSYSSVGTYVNISGVLAGHYTFAVPDAFDPSGSTRYSPVAPADRVTVSSNSTLTLTYSIAYAFVINAVGPGTVSPTSGWVPSGANLSLNATPTGTAVFLGWSGTGPGNYTGPDAQTFVVVRGPLTEIATFAPPSLSSVTTTTSIWDSPLVWAALAVVGLVVGIAVGLVLNRRRPPPDAPTQEPSPEEQTPPPTEPPMEEAP
jgi:hypothetical protein